MELTLLSKTHVRDEYYEGPDFASITLTLPHVKRILQLHEAAVALDCASIEDYDTTPVYKAIDWDICEDEENPKAEELKDWTKSTECDRLVVGKTYFHYECEAKNTGVVFSTDGISIEALKQIVAIENASPPELLKMVNTKWDDDAIKKFFDSKFEMRIAQTA